MAAQNLADLSDALSQIFAPMLWRQMNRQSVLAGLLMKVDGRSKNLAWDVTFDGQTGASTFTEGADVTSGDLQNDDEEDAILSWGLYRRNFGISGLALAAASSSPNNAVEYLDMVVKKGLDSSSRLLSDMNGDLYDGTGSGSIIGLQSALATSGSYATIDKAVDTEWQGNVNTNSSTPRALTKSLLDSLERQIYIASGMTPSVIVTTPAIANKYEALLDAITRQILEQGELSPVIRGMGATVINDNGFTGLHYKGIPIYRDKDCPAEHLFMLNLETIELVSLVQAQQNTSVSFVQRMLEDEKMRPSGINARLEALAKTGDADKYTVKLYPQQCVKRPNASGFIDDIDES